VPIPARLVRLKKPSSQDGWRRVWLLLKLAACIDVLWLFTLFVWSMQFAHFSQSSRPDAIAVLYADFGPSLARTARSLDQATTLREIAPGAMILCIGGNRPLSGERWGHRMRDYLVARGIPSSAIVCDTTSFDTRTNILAIASLSAEHGFDAVHVIAHRPHAPRVAHYLREKVPTLTTSVILATAHPSTLAAMVDFVLAAQHEAIAWIAMLLPPKLHESILRWIRR